MAVFSKKKNIRKIRRLRKRTLKGGDSELTQEELQESKERCGKYFSNPNWSDSADATLKSMCVLNRNNLIKNLKIVKEQNLIGKYSEKFEKALAIS